MEHMKDFPFEYVKPFLPCFDLLKRSNVRIFTYNNSSFVSVYWHTFFLVPCAIGFYVSLSANMYKVFSGDLDIVELAYIVPVYLVSTQGILKTMTLTMNKSEINALINDLGTIWRRTGLSQEQITKKDSLLKRLNFCNSVFCQLNIFGSWQYILAPLLETIFRIFILKQETDFLLPFACFYPFDPTDNWIIYIVIYLFEGYTMFHIVYVYLGAEILMITLCGHLSIELVLLRENLLRVKTTSNKNGTRDVTSGFNNKAPLDEGAEYGIDDIVRRHQKLIRLCQRLDNIFNTMIFRNLLTATITICFFGFVAKFSRGPTDMINNFIGVVASIIPIFNLCYYGEMLAEASVSIASASYESLWYECSSSHQKALVIIMLRAQRSCCLTSLKYAPITLNTFSAVLSTTWSYFSIAKSMYEED
uniref:Odorant receptor n=1 Tax=Eogystia hippophaecolus TaxID=1206364 RepID=A0A1B3P5N3_EOGHI|nr:odorant receptor [Eogystia hippophaecolus]